MRPASASLRVMAPDGGILGPSSVAWQVDREAMLLLGAGPRAILMQLAHPAVAAGVAGHSDFRRDPWRRLDGTLRSYLRIIYGSTPVARAEIGRLNAMHRTIVGPGYDARDPALSLWVHATLVDSSLVAYHRWWRSLSEADAARFYQETRPIALALGVPDAVLPVDLEGFRAYLVGQLVPDGPIAVSATARELAQAVLHPALPAALRLLPVPPRLYGWTMWPAIGLLPPAVRAGYGLQWGSRERAVAAWLVTGWRTWAAALPARARQMPQALAADRRMAGGQ